MTDRDNKPWTAPVMDYGSDHGFKWKEDVLPVLILFAFILICLGG